MKSQINPVFGKKMTGVIYHIRPGAYAVIFDDGRRVAAIRGASGYFLPGGGIESGETSGAALHREVHEECAATVKILETIGQATDFIYSSSEDTHFEKQGVFYLARFVSAPVSNDLEWLPLDQIENFFRQQGHAWAVRQAINQPAK